MFKEAALRRFWVCQPESTLRPRLFGRLYPDIPGLAGTNPAFLAAFFGAGLTDTGSPYYSHLVRWKNNARARRFYSNETVEAVARNARNGPLLPELPESFSTWGPLQRSQYLEISVFLSQYLLSSQGDRMAMAHSVESRYPFLDYRVIEFCNRLPSSMKMRGLREKYLLRLLGSELLPRDVWRRPKHSYRAPIYRSFFRPSPPDYVRHALSGQEVRAAGLFNPAAVGHLAQKAASGAHLGETDEMALAGILSTQLAYRQFVAGFAIRPALTEQGMKICSAPLEPARAARS